jgi:putative addiction module killer protein
MAIRVVEYVDELGRNPFRRWFEDLDAPTAAKVTVALIRIEKGNLASLKSLGGGLFEHRIDWGPGYRIYLGRKGSELMVLLGGGTKRRQNDDIEAARELWRIVKNQPGS